MAQIILDISPNTHKNDYEIIHRMIYAIRDIDTHKHDIVFKTQIFKEAPPNLPILPDALNFFGFAAKLAGYKWTASVFDLDSLNLLMKYESEIPFVKIPCRPELYWLAGEIKRKIPIYQSESPDWDRYGSFNVDVVLKCVPKYPASAEEYESIFFHFIDGISDHTVGFKLWYTYKPSIWEVHYKEPTSTGPDAGPFAKTAEDLKEIL